MGKNENHSFTRRKEAPSRQGTQGDAKGLYAKPLRWVSLSLFTHSSARVHEKKKRPAN